MKNLTLDEFKRFMRIGNLLAFPFATIVVIQVLKKVNSTIGVKAYRVIVTADQGICTKTDEPSKWKNHYGHHHHSRIEDGEQCCL